jgi:hypothetical protein
MLREKIAANYHPVLKSCSCCRHGYQLPTLHRLPPRTRVSITVFSGMQKTGILRHVTRIGLPNRGTRYRLTIILSDPPGRQLADPRSWGSLTVRLRFLRHTISSEAEAGDNVHHAPVKMGLGRVQTIFGRPDAFGLR